MNRQMRKASEREGRRLQALPWDKFRDVTLEAVERHRLLNSKSTFVVDQVFRNNKYIVQIFKKVERKGKFYTKVLIRRSDSQPIYSWNDLYRIKNEIFGEEIEAIQFMPPLSELVDVANLYWFFIETTKDEGSK